MDTDYERRTRSTGPGGPVQFHDMGMRKHSWAAPPARRYFRCRAGRERDEAVGLRDQDVQVGIMGLGVGMVWVPQVMDGIDQRFPDCPQCAHQRPEAVVVLRVEAELHMEDVE